MSIENPLPEENSSADHSESLHTNAPDPETDPDTTAMVESVSLHSGAVTQEEIDFVNSIFEKTRKEIHKVIVGNDNLLQLILAAMLSGGHILLEGVPGVAKTLMAKLISQCMNIEFKRIQFTPDLLPSDLIGVTLFNMQKTEFIFKKGPIFSNLVLIGGKRGVSS